MTIRYGSAYIIHDELEYPKVCARRVTKKLTDAQECVWKSEKNHLQRYHDGDAFLNRIITTDEI